MKPTKDEILLFQIRIKRIHEAIKNIGMVYKELVDKLMPLGEAIKKLNKAIEKEEKKRKKWKKKSLKKDVKTGNS